MTRLHEYGQSYNILDEFEHGKYFYVETDLGFFYHLIEDEDDGWLDRSVTFTTAKQFLMDGWGEVGDGEKY